MGQVLIIEDDAANAQLIQSFVRSIGLSPAVAPDAASGIEAAFQLMPDIILLDMRLPGNLDGWDVLAEIRNAHETANIPIIVTSVEARADDRQRALEAGCNAYLSKPFVLSELQHIILSHLS